VSGWAIPFTLDCRHCGGEVEEINRSPVIAGAEVRVVVRCGSCQREYVVEVVVSPVSSRPNGPKVGSEAASSPRG
jgi:hypothetical protein